MKNVIPALALMLISSAAAAQKQDTVIINLAKTSKIIFTLEDPKDLEVLKHYDFQLLFEDILRKVEEKNNRIDPQDSTRITEDDEAAPETDAEEEEPAVTDNGDGNHEDDDAEDEGWKNRRNDDSDEEDDDSDNDNDKRGRWHRTWQAFNFDLGTNNYLQDGKFPSDNEAFAVRPWGSWYLALASVQRSRIAKKLFLEWGMGLSWYNFKFQHDNAVIQRQETGVVFSLDQQDVNYKKSKLSASYIQASLIPVLDFGDHGRKPRLWDGYNNDAFRIGFGPYAAYRIGSHSKVVYHDDGKQRDKERDGFFLNNFRYGARLQVGYRSTDLFFNYDLNELFQEGKGPNLNAFSFGVIF